MTELRGDPPHSPGSADGPVRTRSRRRLRTNARPVPRPTVLICRAPHPRAESGARFNGRIHGVRLAEVPYAARPTYRGVRGRDDAAPGCFLIHCPSCGAYTEYRVLRPSEVREQTVDRENPVKTDAGTAPAIQPDGFVS